MVLGLATVLVTATVRPAVPDTSLREEAPKAVPRPSVADLGLVVPVTAIGAEDYRGVVATTRFYGSWLRQLRDFSASA